jgi:hypothetical protein
MIVKHRKDRVSCSSIEQIPGLRQRQTLPSAFFIRLLELNPVLLLAAPQQLPLGGVPPLLLKILGLDSLDHDLLPCSRCSRSLSVGRRCVVIGSISGLVIASIVPDSQYGPGSVGIQIRRRTLSSRPGTTS